MLFRPRHHTSSVTQTAEKASYHTNVQHH